MLVSHQLGWELLLVAGELPPSQVWRSSDEILATQKSWKTAMMGKW